MRAGRSPSVSFASLGFVLVASLAGCAEEPAPLESRDSAIAFDDPGAIPIIGQVVDDEFVPLVAVDVTVEPGGHVATTEDGGTFRLGVRQPGLYTFSVLHAGFNEASVEVDVGPEGISDLILILTPTADGIPYHETEVRTSYTLCSISTGGGCGVPLNTYTSYEYQSTDHSDFTFVIPNRGLRELLVEGTWEESTTSGQTRVFLRNPEGLFLGCNNTQAADRPGGAPTQMYFSTAWPTSPFGFWAEVDSWNNEIGGCAYFVGEEGTEYWFGVRADGKYVPQLDFDRTVNVYLTYWYWAKGDRSFTALET